MNAHKIFFQRITKTVSSSQCQHKEVYKCNYIRVDCSNYVIHHVLIHLGKCVGEEGGGGEKETKQS